MSLLLVLVPGPIARLQVAQLTAVATYGVQGVISSATDRAELTAAAQAQLDPGIHVAVLTPTEG
jgi:ABC-type sugar transport system substrate-binding protein